MMGTHITTVTTYNHIADYTNINTPNNNSELDFEIRSLIKLKVNFFVYYWYILLKDEARTADELLIPIEVIFPSYISLKSYRATFLSWLLRVKLIVKEKVFFETSVIKANKMKSKMVKPLIYFRYYKYYLAKFLSALGHSQMDISL